MKIKLKTILKLWKMMIWKCKNGFGVDNIYMYNVYKEVNIMDDTIIEIIYWDRAQGILMKKSKEEKQIDNEIKMNKHEEKLRELIDKVYSDRLKKQLNKYVDLTFEDLLARDSATMEKYYKQGFKDGMNLNKECIC